MDIQNMHNANGKYVLNSSQLHNMKENGIVNPFVTNNLTSSYGLEPIYVMKKQDFAVNHYNSIKGEGGVGSGESLEKRFGKSANDPEMKKRRSAQIKNAQRKYRASHREEYNTYMRKLYDSMKSSEGNVGTFISGQPSKRYGVNEETGGTHSYAGDTSNTEEWYKHRLEKAKIANQNYRKKVKAERMYANLDNIIKKELKKKFKTEFKKKRGRPSKTDTKEIFNPDSEWYKKNYEILRKQKEEELDKIPKVARDLPLKEEPEYPLGVYKTYKNFKPNELITSIEDLTATQRKEYEKNPTEFNKKMQKERKKKKEQNIVMTIQEVDEETPFKPKPEKKIKKPSNLTQDQERVLEYIRDYNKRNPNYKLGEDRAVRQTDLLINSPAFKEWEKTKK
jgi:hypothetical protein